LGWEDILFILFLIGTYTFTMEPLTGPPLITDDPPPPYPSRDRRRTLRTSRRHTRPSTDVEQHSPTTTDPDINENTPLLLAPHSSSQIRRPSTSFRARPRSLSHTSVASASPSLAQTVISLFQDCDPADHRAEDDADVDVDGVGAGTDGGDAEVEYDILGDADRHCVHGDIHLHQDSTPVSARFSKRGWSRYFRPMRKKVYYMALFHLLFLNFPYALAAWVYLFVFTLVSTPIYFGFFLLVPMFVGG
jgi:hypothetical protein